MGMSIPNVRACESNSGSHVAREPTHPTFTWQQARTDHKKWYVLLLLAWQVCQYSLKRDQDSHRKEVKSLQARSGSLCTQENLETETFCALVTCYIT